MDRSRLFLDIPCILTRSVENFRFKNPALDNRTKVEVGAGKIHAKYWLNTRGTMKCPKKYVKDAFFTWGHMHFILKCPKIEHFHFRFISRFKTSHVFFLWNAPIFYVGIFWNAPFFLSHSANGWENGWIHPFSFLRDFPKNLWRWILSCDGILNFCLKCPKIENIVLFNQI